MAPCLYDQCCLFYSGMTPNVDGVLIGCTSYDHYEPPLRTMQCPKGNAKLAKSLLRVEQAAPEMERPQRLSDTVFCLMLGEARQCLWPGRSGGIGYMQTAYRAIRSIIPVPLSITSRLIRFLRLSRISGHFFHAKA